ncbi:bifunctional UDP-3-O-[3-hydroxymyristoyl] N-acetylglucosamine deacetylase/3-hydroxyacyl-ACP dehydratase [Lacibacter luteus]|uniref:Multifunctional fusion protein n=1 Tax=Lacibacter luteus TaxID=2508719 RepID=A0A4Q1CFU7_9BACT|nr:bifunctional UDP-3-O-[3-hydroxymyristoyl] N-acetylglucosamine deacetylase/3-hydroxyacyl-ACP dehydratase [Lacibacter luteus]RXK58527.1 bifunctional UDP-3-O-[3-hydroxymyristoyl] N-acetylglucosamine deacetylase/3-hydroxyacyl-ACP dehydratase [Lacibacter luteus]
MNQSNGNSHSNQHTLGQPITISGVGIHTGASVTMTLEPAEPSTGIVFQRIDLPNQPSVKADVDFVTETNRSTTLSNNGATVSTIEHLLAAFAGCEIDNVLVKIDGPEVPILDGSSQPFVEALEKAGRQKQDAIKTWYTIDHNIFFLDENKKVEMVAMPADSFRINTLIDFNSPVLGTQHAQMSNIEEFNNEIASCRTFSFFHELEFLLKNNLIKGGDLNNAIVVVDKPVSDEQLETLSKAFGKEKFAVTSEGYLNNLKLRFPNEPARHKLLDLVGDLSLVGMPFKAHIIANRPGHASNVEFARKIKEHIKKNRFKANVPAYFPDKPPVYDVTQIEKIMPHRYPFLLVDKIIDLTDTYIVGVKNVTYNEPFFQGHFPGNYVMPGVLQVEALAQCGGLLAIPKDTDDKYDTYFLKVDNCKFKQKVVPGDTLILKMELKSPIRRGIVEMKGTIFVGSKVTCEADLTAQIVKRTKNDQ